MFGDL